MGGNYLHLNWLHSRISGFEVLWIQFVVLKQNLGFFSSRVGLSGVVQIWYDRVTSCFGDFQRNQWFQTRTQHPLSDSSAEGWVSDVSWGGFGLFLYEFHYGRWTRWRGDQDRLWKAWKECKLDETLTFPKFSRVTVRLTCSFFSWFDLYFWRLYNCCIHCASGRLVSFDP